VTVEVRLVPKISQYLDRPGTLTPAVYRET
jgi:hypothetical protein